MVARWPPSGNREDGHCCSSPIGRTSPTFAGEKTAMNENLPSTEQAACPPGYRAAGLLLHITSLPSPYGIGDMGPGAHAWIDQLAQAGQSWWQSLPLGPTGFGNSPYSPLSSFAGNWLLISPEGLIKDGLLRTAEVPQVAFPEFTVDFEQVSVFKHRLLETVWSNLHARLSQELRLAYDQFREEQAHWLEDYALFAALKAKFGDVSYMEWPIELIQRKASALDRARQELAVHVDQVKLAQFLVFRQGTQLKDYAHARGVRLIGDLPFFVSLDSCDVWVNPELFLLDARHHPLVVAGVPPDYFSACGQLWGNPVYDWERIHETNYAWCIDRVRALLAHVDLIRLDHFRAFAAAWHVPSDAATAEIGKWVPGPGSDFFHAVQREVGRLPFIAEDLGLITKDVHALRDEFGLPGTRVLQFGFDGKADNPHLPENFVPDSVVYTGTHDNNTTRGWYDELPEDQREHLWEILQVPRDDAQAARALIRMAWSSKAALALAPLQDLLNLEANARMNVPGLAEGNWHWRATQEMLSPAAFQWLRELTEDCRRWPRTR